MGNVADPALWVLDEVECGWHGWWHFVRGIGVKKYGLFGSMVKEGNCQAAVTIS